jgi:hypothetical protein
MKVDRYWCFFGFLFRLFRGGKKRAKIKNSKNTFTRWTDQSVSRGRNHIQDVPAEVLLDFYFPGSSIVEFSEANKFGMNINTLAMGRYLFCCSFQLLTISE